MILLILIGLVCGLFFPLVLARVSPGSAKLIYSYPFLFALGLISLYLITSNARGFGNALMLGVGLNLVGDLWWRRSDLDLLKKRWFVVYTVKLNDKELHMFIYLALGFWGLLSLLFLRPGIL